MKYHLKKYFEDFCVNESLPLNFSAEADADYYYYFMLKKNYSTFEAVRLLAEKLAINIKDIGFAGLKDEDGVTTQHIAIKKLALAVAPTTIVFPETENSFSRLSYLGAGKHPIMIGTLNGNSFKIILRDIDQQFANYLRPDNKSTFYFINYYGPQRFGMPNETKDTFLIGQALLQGDFAHAKQLLSKQSSFEGQAAKRSTNDAKAFFATLDQRQYAFYINSYESYQWNEKIAQAIRSNTKNWGTSIQEGISYTLFNQIQDGIAFLSKLACLTFNRFTYQDGQFINKKIERNTIVQTDVYCHRIFTHESELCAELSFFLPSGSYATVAINQIVHQVTRQINKISFQEAQVC